MLLSCIDLNLLTGFTLLGSYGSTDGSTDGSDDGRIGRLSVQHKTVKTNRRSY